MTTEISSKSDALALIQALIQENGLNFSELLSVCSPAAAPPITSDLYERFLSYLDTSEATVATYTRYLRQFDRWTRENNVTHPTRADILAYREDLKKRCKPATVHGYLVAVRLFFQWTEIEGLYPNVAQHIKGGKIDHAYKRDALTAYQLRNVMQYAEAQAKDGTERSQRNLVILSLLAFNGLRTIELIRANVEDFRTRSGEQVLYVQGKGHEEKSEYVRIEPETEAVIRTYLSKRKKLKVSDPLIASVSDRNYGDRLTTRSVRGIAKKALRDVGLDDPRLTAHSFRHTFCTIAAQTCSTESVREAARHTKLETTEIYIHAQSMLHNPCSRAVIDSIKSE